MGCLEAPLPLVEKIQAGLIGVNVSLGPAVAVRVARWRRDRYVWPALMVAALVVAPNMPRGVPAVWATGKQGGPILAVDGAAREYSDWGMASQGDSIVWAKKNMLTRFPEAEAARRCLPSKD